MATAAEMTASAKYAAFNIVDVNYKEVNGSAIPASIMIPKNIKPGIHPVVVKWHGGALITGHRLFPGWFPDWILQLGLRKDAIFICPDYRLMPEVSGMDILQDLQDFYAWLAMPGSLAAILPSGVAPDIDHLLVTGESAGGWLALQSALLPASRPKVSAVISQYPMIDMRDPHYTEDYEKPLYTPLAPQLDRSLLRNYFANMKKGETISSAVPPDRIALVISAVQQGVIGKMLGDENILYPLEVLYQVDKLPPTWLIHGKDDKMVPVEGSYKYVKALKEKVPKTELHFSYQEGSHGFDIEPGVDLKTEWVRQGVQFIEVYWPKC